MRVRPWQGVLVCLVIIMALVAGCGTKAGEALKFETLEQGAYSGITEKKAVLVTDQAAWAALWGAHGQDGTMPVIQFQEESVLAVYLGERNSGGYSVTVTEVRIDGNKVTVTVQESKPGSGTMVTGAMSQPFHMVKLAQVPAGAEMTVTWK